MEISNSTEKMREFIFESEARGAMLLDIMGVLFLLMIIMLICIIIYNIRKQNQPLEGLIDILKQSLKAKNTQEIKYVFRQDSSLGEFFDKLEQYGSAVFDKNRLKEIDDAISEALADLEKNGSGKLEQVQNNFFDERDELLKSIGKNMLNIFLGQNANYDLEEVTNQIKYLIGFVKIEQAKIKQKKEIK